MPRTTTTFVLFKNDSKTWYISDDKDKIARSSGVTRYQVNASILRHDGYLYDSAGNKIGRLIEITRDADDDVSLMTEEGMALVKNIWNKVVSEAALKKMQLTNDLRILLPTIKGGFLTASALADVLVRHDIPSSADFVMECLVEAGYKEPQLPPRAGIQLNSSQLVNGARYMAKVHNKLTFGGNGPFLQTHYETDQDKIIKSLIDTSNNAEPLITRITSAVSDSQARIKQMNIDALPSSNKTSEMMESIDLLEWRGGKKDDGVEVEESSDDKEAASTNGGPAAAGGGNVDATLNPFQARASIGTKKEIEDKIEQIKQLEDDIASILDGRNEDDLNRRGLKWNSLWMQNKRAQGAKKAELDDAIKNGLKDDYNEYRKLLETRKNLEELRRELAVLRDPSVDAEALKRRSAIIKQIKSHEDAIEKQLEGTTEDALNSGSNAFKKWKYAKGKAIKAGTTIPAEPPQLRKQSNAYQTLVARKKKLAPLREKLKALDRGLATKPPASLTVTPVSEQVAEPTAKREAQDDGESKPPAKKRARRKKAATEDQEMQSARPTLPLPALPFDHVFPPLTLVDPSWSMESDDTPVDTDAPTNTAFV